MKAKYLVISISLMLLSCVGIANGQGAKEPSAVAATIATTSKTPEMSAEDRLKIRDVQYRYAQRAFRMKEMQQVYAQLLDAQKADDETIAQLIVAAAKAAGVDATKWAVNTEELKFVARPPDVAPTVPSKPKD